MIIVNGNKINVTPNGKYQLVTHMKLNDWTNQSHVALDGFSETSKVWHPLVQCPSGINGPLAWHEFSCELVIPENTTKIRTVLNAGWSSQPNKEATTWFDGVNILASVSS